MKKKLLTTIQYIKDLSLYKKEINRENSTRSLKLPELTLIYVLINQTSHMQWNIFLIKQGYNKREKEYRTGGPGIHIKEKEQGKKRKRK